MVEVKVRRGLKDTREIGAPREEGTYRRELLERHSSAGTRGRRPRMGRHGDLRERGEPCGGTVLLLEDVQPSPSDTPLGEHLEERSLINDSPT